MLLRSSIYDRLLLYSREITTEVFQVSLITYLLFYLIDNFKIGFISDYFNLNALLWIALASGTLSIWFKSDVIEEKTESKAVKIRNYIFIIALSLISVGLIYYKIKSIGKFSYFVSPLCGLLILLLSILFLHDSESTNGQDHMTSSNWFKSIKSKLK
jgi:purine-cytosine permease-like protein